MKRKEILMLVCAFFLGFFANAILKSSCMSKLYEGLEPQGCTMANIMQVLQEGSLERAHLEAMGCEEAVIQRMLGEFGPSN